MGMSSYNWFGPTPSRPLSITEATELLYSDTATTMGSDPSSLDVALSPLMEIFAGPKSSIESPSPHTMASVPLLGSTLPSIPAFTGFSITTAEMATIVTMVVPKSSLPSLNLTTCSNTSLLSHCGSDNSGGLRVSCRSSRKKQTSLAVA